MNRAVRTNRDVVPSDRHELVRRANVELVFRTITDHAPVSRADLIKLTRLSKPTVLAVVAALEEESLIRPAPLSAHPDRRRGAGRTPAAYEPDPQAAYVIGVDVGGTKIAAALADLSGKVIAEFEEPTSRRGGEEVVRQIAELARRLARSAHVPWQRVDAVCVGTPGVENADGTIRMADNVHGLDRVKVASTLRRSLRTSILIENDVNLAAIGELEVGVADDCNTFVLLAIGTGVGMGIIIDGQLARGGRGGAGEVAYLPLGADPSTSDARRRGAFELTASGSGVQDLLAAELAERNGQAAESSLVAPSDAHEIYDAAANGDPVAIAVVRRHAAAVANAVLVAAAVIDPELVVLGGGIGSNPQLIDPLREAVAAITPWPVRIVTSALGSRAGVLGAVSHARRSLPEIESQRVSARLHTTSEGSHQMEHQP